VTPDPALTAWFVEHVLRHEPTLRAWLQSRFGSQLDIDDVVQEAYARVVRARAEGELHAPKAFLFAIARNLALDHLRRHHVTRTGPLVENDALNVLDEHGDVAEIVARNQELALLTEAIQSLPDRCRQIFTLRKIYGLAQREIAQRLSISEHTVSAQLTIGLHKCTEYFVEHRRERGGAR
jgi:RNA polymerase sigma factor (sigma-70 family)